MMDAAEIRAAAGLHAARAARAINPTSIEGPGLDSLDALRIYQAIVSADLHLEWTRPPISRPVKVVAIVGSPIIVVVLALLWTAWRIEKVIKGVRRVDQPPRKHRRT